MAGLGKLCHECRGVGTVPSHDGVPPSIPCLPCGGTGYEDWGKVDLTDLIAKLDALDTKMDTLDTHLDAIEAKIDAL